MKFVLTVDTEADAHKSTALPLTLRNLASISRLQELCEKYDVPPTYLVTYEVAEHKETSETLARWQKEGKAEVGAHLHPWSTPPASPSDDHLSFPTELSDAELEEKFSALTRKIEEAVGKKPTSYRAGRWGFDERQARLLAQHGYIVDCSLTPGVDWSRMGGPDFRKAPLHPHVLPSGIAEVPMTIVPTALFGFRRKWLRVFPTTTGKAWSRIYSAAIKKKLSVLMFMVHSSELHLGTSSYTPTEASVEHMFDRLEELFTFLKKKGVRGTSLSDFARAEVL